MKNALIFCFLFIFFKCRTPEPSNDLIPVAYQFPDDSIGHGKKFIYHKNGSVETTSSELHLINENDTSFRILKNNEAGVAIDSFKTAKGKLLDLYTFYMSGDGSPTKAIIQTDTLLKNGTKYGVKQTRYKFETDYNTYSTKIEQHYLKDTTIYSFKKHVPCIVIVSRTDIEMIPKEGADANRPYKYSSYGFTYFGKGLGKVRYTQQFKDHNDSWDLIKIKEVY